MEGDCQLIESFLQTTGLTCEDLLQKLQKYKSIKSSDSNEENSKNSDKKNEKSVILETKSSILESTKSKEQNGTQIINNLSQDVEIDKSKGAVFEDNNIRFDLDRKFKGKVSVMILDRLKSLEEDEKKEEIKEYNNALSNDDKNIEECQSDNKNQDDNEKETIESPSKDDILPDADNLPKSEDSIRNILKMQLSSLRNMKKSTPYLPDLQKPSLSFQNLKKKRKSCDISFLSTSEKDETNSEDGIDQTSENKTISSNENSLVSLSDETQFLIVNVTGGVDLIESETTERVFSSISNSEKEAPNLSVKSLSTNFHEDSGINKSVKNSEKSPFVSDSLEDFLNESAQLKISYSIPKLRAEEGINESTKSSPYDSLKKVEKIEQNSVPNKEKTKLVKAKTLAEMRRHFEKMNVKTSQNELKRFKRKRVEEEETPFISSNRNSYIIYNNKKIWVNSKEKDKCLEIINSPKFAKLKPVIKEEFKPIKRLSLLSCLSKKRKNKSIYKAGPLSKKPLLQNKESRSKWTTEIKNLPKIYLEIIPEVCKAIDPKLIHLLPVFSDSVITEERTKFALTALKINQSEPKSFSFYVPYQNNQKQIIVRKPVGYKAQIHTQNYDPTPEVKTVLNNIISYIEVKELEDSLIKDDDCVIESEPIVKEKIRKVKPKKLDRELLRLNCKVIDVAMNESEDTNCIKAFCKMGCVCKSLLCEGVLSDHCQRIECMFECTCKWTQSKRLSVHTVTHLEDKAKKNLAKVEREFTQTLIHTDGNAILVGTAKERRCSKPPKKFTDYIKDDPIDISNEVGKKPKCKPCSVVLQKLHLNSIIPYCLNHQKYNCFCMEKIKIKEVEKIETPKTEETKKPNKRKQCFVVREDEPLPIVETKKEKEFALQRRKKKIKTKHVTETYNPVFDGEIKVSLKENQEMLKMISNQEGMQYLRILPWSKLINCFQSKKMNIWCKTKGPLLLLCNTVGYFPPKNFINIRESAPRSDIMKWILTDKLPDSIPRELMHIILTPRKEHFVISGYCLKKENSISMTTPKIAETDLQKSPLFEPVRVGETEEEITKEKNRQKKTPIPILPKPLPKLDVIRKEVKIGTDMPSSSVDNVKVPNLEPEVIEIEYSDNQTKIESPEAKMSLPLAPNQILKCKHKDMYNSDKILLMSSKVLHKRVLYCHKHNIQLAAPLPRIAKSCKWRMIYLNSDFSYLRFIKGDYSIKYSDLMDVLKMATNTKCTITLKNTEYWDFKHPLFGIFCVPNYQDRIFIGPYLQCESSNIETLRYLKKILIDTQVFNKMIGKKNSEKDPVWLFETPQPVVSTLNSEIIDITDEEIKDLLPIPENCFLFPPFVEELKNEDLKTTVNRYIVTNIPHLGYFEAAQTKGKSIDVFWPGRKKGYRFRNLALAKYILTHYLNEIFYAIPQNFRISVIIMTDLQKTDKPIEMKYFTKKGPFICGDFGIFEKVNLPRQYLADHRISPNELCVKSEKQISQQEEILIQIFSVFLMTNNELLKYTETEKVLEWAKSEIYILQKLAENYEREKIDLQNLIKEKKEQLNGRSKKSIKINKPIVTETIEIEDSDEEVSTTMIFRKITTSGKIQTGGNNYQTQERSLLKSNQQRSLLKGKTSTGLDKVKMTENSRLLLDKSNVVYNDKKLLITKLS